MAKTKAQLEAESKAADGTDKSSNDTTSDDTETKSTATDDSRPAVESRGRVSDNEAALKRAESAKVGDDGMPQHDEYDLAALKGPKGGAVKPAKVETDPPEAKENGADWFEGRDPNDVVEVSGQRETVEARMARNGQASPEKAAGATTLSHG
jgi:hypothetical protein